jgi:hypothetical protein
VTTKKFEPGVARAERISAEGLERLEKQLQSGVNISTVVLSQWIRRYGDPARRLIRKYNRYHKALDHIE